MDYTGPLMGTHGVGLNPSLYESINCVTRNNIISNVTSGGITMYAALNPTVIYNTVYGVASVLQSPTLFSAVQHWVDGTATGQPITGCVNPTVAFNIFQINEFAYDSTMIDLREYMSYANDSVLVAGLGRGAGVAGHIDGNIYSKQGQRATGPWQFNHGVQFNDNRPDSLWMGNLSGWQQHSGYDVHSTEDDPRLSATFVPLPCSAVVAAVHAFNSTPVAFDDYDGTARLAAGGSGAFAGARRPGAGAFRKPFPPLTAVPDYTGPHLHPVFTPVWPRDVWAAHVPVFWVVSPHGNDGNVGNATYPFQTIYRALYLALPGDHILLRGNAGPHGCPGELYENPNITIRAFPGDARPVLTMSTGWEPSGSCMHFKNGNSGGMVEATIDGLDLSGGYYYVIMFDSGGGGWSEYWQWWKTSVGRVSPGRTRITNCKIHGSGTNLIKFSPDNDAVDFIGNEFYDSGRPRDATTAGTNPTVGDAVTPIVNTSDPAAPVNLVAGGSGNGIDVRGSSFIRIADNYFHDIRGTGVLLGGGAKGCIVERNLFSRVRDLGIVVGSFNTEAMYNDAETNFALLYEARDTIVRNNVVVGTGGAAIGIYSTNGTRVLFNTFAAAASKMQGPLLFNLAPHYVTLTQDMWTPNAHCEIYGNIFMHAAGATGPMVEIREWVSDTVPDPLYTPPNLTCANSPYPSSTGGAAAPAVVGRNADGSCPVFPPSHPMNVDISGYPVHPDSAGILAFVGTAGSLHPDFGCAARCGVP